MPDARADSADRDEGVHVERDLPDRDQPRPAGWSFKPNHAGASFVDGGLSLDATISGSSGFVLGDPDASHGDASLPDRQPDHEASLPHPGIYWGGIILEGGGPHRAAPLRHQTVASGPSRPGIFAAKRADLLPVVPHRPEWRQRTHPHTQTAQRPAHRNPQDLRQRRPEGRRPNAELPLRHPALQPRLDRDERVHVERDLPDRDQPRPAGVELQAEPRRRIIRRRRAEPGRNHRERRGVRPGRS